MEANPNAGSFNLVFGHGAVAIPPHHPAYTGAPPTTRSATPRRATPRQWAATAVTIAGLLSIAAFAAITAHYMLQFVQPGSESAVAAQAPAEAAPEAASSAGAVLPAPVSPSPVATMETTAAPVTMPAVSVGEAAAPAVPKRVHAAAKAKKLAARANRRKPAIQQAETMEAANPPAVELPARMFTPVAPYPLPPKGAN